jgi:hypothetical protein
LLTVVEGVWRLSLLTLVHFRIDSLFQGLLTALGASPGKAGFGKNLNDLTGKLTLADPRRIKDVLNTPTLIRNSIHNNGIHRGSDWGPITHHGLTYEFRKDKDVQCASSAHVLAALDASVDALESILLSPEINALTRVEDPSTSLNQGESVR